jgi:hypothetical protein
VAKRKTELQKIATPEKPRKPFSDFFRGERPYAHAQGFQKLHCARVRSGAGTPMVCLRYVSSLMKYEDHGVFIEITANVEPANKGKLCG